MRRDRRTTHHIATVSHAGRFWDAYLELADESQTPGRPCRGRIAFSAADQGEEEPVRTTTIFLEDTPQEVLNRARQFKTHQIVALLRSALPPEDQEEREAPPPDEDPPDSGEPPPSQSAGGTP